MLGAHAAGEGRRAVMRRIGLPLTGDRIAGREAQSSAFFSTPDMPSVIIFGRDDDQAVTSMIAWRMSRADGGVFPLSRSGS